MAGAAPARHSLCLLIAPTFAAMIASIVAPRRCRRTNGLALRRGALFAVAWSAGLALARRCIGASRICVVGWLRIHVMSRRNLLFHLGYSYVDCPWLPGRAIFAICSRIPCGTRCTSTPRRFTRSIESPFSSPRCSQPGLSGVTTYASRSSAGINCEASISFLDFYSYIPTVPSATS